MAPDSLHKFPKKLYLFMPAKYLMDCLEKDEIKVCLPSDCNDPFELVPEKLEGKPTPDTEDVGFICFSQEWGSSTMWAHYADKHQGVCLEFSFKESDDVVTVEEGEGEDHETYTDSAVLALDHLEQYTELPITEGPRFAPILMKVKYHPHRAYPANSQVRCIVRGTKIEDARFSRMYAAKGQEWAYEKEWRLFVTLDNCLSYHNGCYFVKGITRYITKVMMGWKCKLPQPYVQRVLDSMPERKATCMKMEPNGNLFAVKEEGKADAPEPPVWRPYLEFDDSQWRAIKENIKKHIGIDNMKGIDYKQAIIDLLINQTQDPDNQETK